MKQHIIPLYNPTDKVVVKSEGCYQYDSDGKEYIDFESGVWCVNLGHSHKKIVEAITTHAQHSIHHGYKFRNTYSEELSLKLQQLIGYESGASVFLSSGSEAVSLAITIAQRITGKKKILRISNSYLSAYGIGQLSPDNEFVVNLEFNNLESLNKIKFNDISAFVLEIGGASVEMVQFPNYDFLQQAVEKAKKHECIIISDEVTTGIGRMGKWFGFQHYDILPDMVVTGKALGNGYPISAVTMSNELLKAFNKNPFIYAQSHQNDPLGCAIGLEVIKTIEQENIIEHCCKMSNYFNHSLISLQKEYPQYIKEIRINGLMIAIEFNALLDGNKVFEKLFENGFILSYKLNALRLLPPLVITEKEIDLFITNLNNILKNN